MSLTTSSEDSMGYNADLRQLLVTRFNESELRDICFDLGIDYESLAGHTKPDKVRELLLFLNRRGTFENFLNVAKQQRPDILWEELNYKSNSSIVSKPESQPYFKRKSLRFWSLFIVIVLVISLTVLESILNDQEQLQISQILWSVSDTYYQIEVFVKNSSGSEVLARNILFSAHKINGDPARCSLVSGVPPPIVVYEFAGIVNLTKTENTTIFQTGVSSQEQENSKYQANGSIESINRSGCVMTTFKLDLDTAFVLPYDEGISVFYLQLPKNFETTFATAPNSESVEFVLNDYSTMCVEMDLDWQDETIDQCSLLFE